MAQQRYYDPEDILRLLKRAGGEYVSDEGRVTPEIADLLGWPRDAAGRALATLHQNRRITRSIRGKRTYRVAVRNPDEPDDPLTMMTLATKDVVHVHNLRHEAEELEADIRRRLRGRMPKAEIDALFMED